MIITVCKNSLIRKVSFLDEKNNYISAILNRTNLSSQIISIPEVKAVHAPITPVRHAKENNFVTQRNLTVDLQGFIDEVNKNEFNTDFHSPFNRHNSHLNFLTT